jgi:hypothetical protein
MLEVVRWNDDEGITHDAPRMHIVAVFILLMLKNLIFVSELILI